MKIETGRYTNPSPTPVEERVCDLCEVIEDEKQFLINCSLPDNSNRAKLLGRCTSLWPQFEHLTSTGKFIFIMSNKKNKLLSLLTNTIKPGFLFICLAWYIPE